MVLAGCWPQPDGDADRSGHNPFEATLTTANVANLQPRWRRELVGLTGSPVTSTGGVHVVTSTGPSNNPTLHTVRPGDGSTAWASPITDFPHRGLSGPWVIADQVTAGWFYWQVRPIIVDAGAPSFDVADGDFVADIGDGAVEAQRGRRVLVRREAMSDPLTLSTYFQLLDLDTHGLVSQWTVPGSAFRVTLGQHRLYVSGFGKVEARSTADAALAWTAPVPGWARRPVLSADEATVYVVGDPVDGDATLHALDAATGSVLWTAPLGPDAEMPALAEGRLHVPVSTGEVLTFNAAGCGAASCPPLWRSSTGAARVPAGQPAVAGGVVFTTWTDGTVTGGDAAGCATPPCAPLWSGATGVGAAVGGPIVSNGQVYARTDDHLVAFGLP